MIYGKLFAAAAVLFSQARAAAVPAAVQPEDVKVKRASCDNTATSRDCWGDYDLNSNWYQETPDTGVTREYWLNVVNTTLAPDGIERYTLSFNGTIPGPTIFADWGDNLVIHVTNNLDINGTAIHWHGIRQLGSGEYDGVPGVTQCAIVPTGEMTYKFQATQYGTTWYHSHFTLQYGDGLLGPLIINGPASANYEEDLGAMFLSDWAHESVFSLWDAARVGAPPTLENGLINGTNVYNNSGTITGARWETTVESNTTYRLRLINSAVDGYIRFSIDNHDFQVIANDLVPIVPYTSDNIVIGIGQRYDIVFTANQTTGDYWLRATWQTSCSQNGAADNILGIIRYDSSSTADPTTTNDNLITSTCGDEPLASLSPYLNLQVGDAATETELSLSFAFTNYFKWTINSTALNASSLYLNWEDPTFLKVYNGDAIFPANYSVQPITVVDEWVYWVIEDNSGIGLNHPIHLHGHDFFVLAQATGTFSDDIALNTDNPPRRDVATLPANGYLVLAWQSDNPGAWLMHCHIAWHASEGLAMQFVERESEINATISDPSLLVDTCNTWNTYYPTEAYPQDDSGI